MEEIKETSPHGNEKTTNAFVADCQDKWVVEYIAKHLTTQAGKNVSTSKILRYLIHNALIVYLGQEEYDRLSNQYKQTQIEADEKIDAIRAAIKGE